MKFLKPIQISQEFLYAVKVDKDVSSFINELANLNKGKFSEFLGTENEKKAFWINIYNAFIQIKGKGNLDLLRKRKLHFFGKNWINICGNDLSFNFIEHGILRSSKVIWALGYLDKWFPSTFEKQFRVKSIDYRIHFALNCAAKGCPPIVFYTPENIDEQLDKATGSFLQLESQYFKEENKIIVSKLMLMYLGDFGGHSGIRKMLKKYGIIPTTANPKITYKDYDWTIALQNYAA